MGGLFSKEQKILDDALSHVGEIKNGLPVNAGHFEALVNEYALFLEEQQQILEISDKASVGLLHEQKNKAVQIDGLKSELHQVMENLHNSVKTSQEKKVYVQTFGNFEVFVDGRPLRFARTKTKELFAYLVMRRGARCNNNEIVAAIWENKPDSPTLQSQYRHLVSDLTKTLKSVNAEDVLIKQRGSLAIIPEKLSCDLYDFFTADTDAVSNYMGEFMTQYSWAEFINARLDKM
ncbi:MAG: hypothetical protein FWE83_06050 [Oscillospiraceae bacterium]|nr:hypothetical protein [Oscillospiraceae bacterium]